VEVGALSPMSPVTLPQEARRVAQIPLDAECFAFAYPLTGAAEAGEMERLNMSDRHICFLALGGYVYLDKTKQVCGINALCQGEGLYFDPPQPFGEPEVRERLFRDGRIQDVTVASLVKCGVKGFCWLRPGERFVSFPHVNGSAWQHGGFLYVFNDRSKDCVYGVSDAERPSGVPLSSTDARDAVESFSVACGARRQQLQHSHAAAQQHSESTDLVCKVCLDSQVEVVLYPCGHLCLCKTCAASAGMQLCPSCRQNGRQRLNVFL